MVCGVRASNNFSGFVAALAGTSAVTAVGGIAAVSDALANLVDVKVYKSQGSSSGGSSEDSTTPKNVYEPSPKHATGAIRAESFLKSKSLMGK